MKTINELIDKASKAKFSSEDEPDYIHVNDVRALMVELVDSCPDLPTPKDPEDDEEYWSNCINLYLMLQQWRKRVKGE